MAAKEEVGKVESRKNVVARMDAVASSKSGDAGLFDIWNAPCATLSGDATVGRTGLDDGEGVSNQKAQEVAEGRGSDEKFKKEKDYTSAWREKHNTSASDPNKKKH